MVGKGKFLDLITNFLVNRTFRVRINNDLSNEFIQGNGDTQGSALSVSLFLIAINDITENCSYPVKFNLYTDDFNLWCRSKYKNTVQNQLQIISSYLKNWTKKLDFNSLPKNQAALSLQKKGKLMN